MTDAGRYIDLANRAIKFDDELAVAILEHAAALVPGSRDVLAKQFELFLMGPDVPAMRAAVEAFRRAGGAEDVYLHYLGVAALKAGDAGEAVDLFERSYAISGDVKTLAELCILPWLTGDRERTARHVAEMLARTEPKQYLNFLADFLDWKLPGGEGRKAEMIAHFRPYKSAAAFRVFRNFSMRTHRVFDEYDNKAGLERALRAAGVPVGRPRTFIAPEDGEGEIELPEGVWIQKPAGGRGGKKTEIHRGPKRVAFGPEQVAQGYVADPLPVFGRKFHVRAHLVFPEMAARSAFLYRDGIARLTPKPISEDYSDLASQITNTAIHGIAEFPDKTLHRNLDRRVVWTLKELLAHLAAQGMEDVEARIAAELGRLVEAFRAPGGLFDRFAADYPASLPVYAGVDLILDRALNVYILEFQKLPSLHGIWPMKAFIDPFFADLFDLAVEGTERADPAKWIRL